MIITVLLAVFSMALAAQDKYALKVPNGLAFSEFRGDENWQDVAVSQTERDQGDRRQSRDDRRV